MKIIITGHTSGVGKAIYDYFKSNENNEVIGLSRSTGFDLSTDLEKVIELSKGCDIFVNNTCIEDCQLQLLNSLYQFVGKMIVIGSRMGDYNHVFNNQYSQIKEKLKDKCYQLNLLSNISILYLNIFKLEDSKDMEFLIPFEKVVNVIDFWLKESMICSVTFDMKMTEQNLQIIKNRFNISYFDELLNEPLQSQK